MNRGKEEDFKSLLNFKSRQSKTSDDEDIVLHISTEDLSLERQDVKSKIRLTKDKLSKAPPATLPKSRIGLRDMSNSNGSSEQVSVESIEESRIGAKDAFLRSEFTSNLKKSDYINGKLNSESEKSESNLSTNGYTSNGISDNYALDKGFKSKDKDVYIGFANLPNQVYRKSVKKGFDFTLMVVGSSGLGKSTLLNSMFLSDIYNNEYPGPSLRASKTVKVEKTSILLKEGGVQLRLTIVDTPGFGDSVDNSNCWQPIIEFIDKQYDQYLNAESRVSRKSITDTRVHCCLYFITPSGHGLKALDIEFMKHLHDKVNIIPLIAKADSLTIEECRDFKKTILNEIIENKINIYEFPDCEDEDEFQQQQKIKERVPFAIVGSNTVVERDGKKLRARIYPWGIVEVENLQHNDFLALRNMLIRTHLHDLKEVTNNVHYENFRYSKLLTAVSGESPRQKFIGNKSPLLQMEEERKEHESKLRKMESEMELVFENKVQEKMNKLTESQQDLQRRAEQMKRSLEQQEQELEQRRMVFANERDHWEEQQKIFDADQTSTLRKKKTIFS